MEPSNPPLVNQLEAEEARARLKIWDYVFGFTRTAVVKCAIQLEIPDILETHGGVMTHSDLSTALGCSPAILHRIMRYLIHLGIFKLQSGQGSSSSSTCYVQTPLSKLLMKRGDNSMAPLILVESCPPMVDALQKLSQQLLASQEGSPFKAAHGVDLWAFTSGSPSYNQLFNDGMASYAKIAMLALIENHGEIFKGIESVVDVGGGDGTSLRTLINEFPWIRGINLDLPHVVSVAPQSVGIKHVAGNMFEAIPKADAALLKWVLHDWGDEECIQILKNCREAIPASTGKVVILEAVIKGGNDMHNGMHFALDMVIFALTEKGKERTIQEWEHVIKAAGFKNFRVKDNQSAVSVIEAYP